MRKWKLVAGLVIAIAVIFAANAIQAGTEVKDIIELKSPEYKNHEKGIVQFTHKKHMDDYAKASPELYKDGCGACHHDDQGKPLASLKIGDNVQRCIECHTKPSEKPKKKKGEKKLSKAEELEYHAEAVHDNCRGCHKAFNKANKTKAAPTTCSKCHPKVKK